MTWKLTPSRIEPGAHALIGPKDEDFVAALTEAVRPCDRRWLDGAKAWLGRGCRANR